MRDSIILFLKANSPSPINVRGGGNRRGKGVAPTIGVFIK